MASHGPEARPSAMLYHRTDQAGRDGIASHGFTQEEPPDGPSWDSPERGRVWFASSKEVARRTCWRRGWWVWIEVPDETPEYVFNDGTSFSGNYSLDIEMVNRLTMTFEVGD